MEYQEYLGKEKFLRLSSIIGPDGVLPFSRSTFYAKIKAGVIPPPIKLGARISVWKASDILSVLQRAEEERLK